MQPNTLPIANETILRHLVDELVPGDGRWPSASEVGVHGVVMLRLFGDQPSSAIEQLALALDCGSDGLLNAASERRISAVRQFEAANPVLFEKIYTAAVLAYYEMPGVVEAIRAGGRPYSTFPHADGYPMPAFDLEHDTPTHGRGRYLRTEDVVPLDVSSIDLGSATTERWGMER
ncbi:hypothetical protein [Aminobacter sp. HY435]|uniref:hypothetical protein n=1 Tax=Aminobacter sp. HY435 TaxID=2970917 RepID=UPI0022B9A21E|nr:hypothetical protein [Aminobacter sp. HY435]